MGWCGIGVRGMSELIRTTPPGVAGLAEVVVTKLDGQSVVVPGGYTYIASPPTVVSMSPDEGPTQGGTDFVIAGENLDPGDVVTINGVVAPGPDPMPPPQGVLLFDGFELADMAATNLDGFRWGSNNKTSIVTMLNGVPTAVYNNGVINNPGPADADWTPHDGDYSLRFRYPAGIDSHAEQRYDLGAPHKDIWFRYWLRVPTNFEHRDGAPFGKASNNKFFALWMDGDQSKGDGSTVIWQIRDDGSKGSVAVFSSSPGQFTGAGGEKQSTPFISVPADQGRWMQVVFHVKAATDRTSNDGAIELWRRWDGEGSFTKIHEALDVDIAPSPNGPDGWKAGYVMGWSNPGYDEDTEWLMDEFTVSDSSLLGGV